MVRDKIEIVSERECHKNNNCVIFISKTTSFFGLHGNIDIVNARR